MRIAPLEKEKKDERKTLELARLRRQVESMRSIPTPSKACTACKARLCSCKGSLCVGWQVVQCDDEELRACLAGALGTGGSEEEGAAEADADDEQSCSRRPTVPRHARRVALREVSIYYGAIRVLNACYVKLLARSALAPRHTIRTSGPRC